ncbi:MAG: hypothetical protein IKD75_10250 [Prevotella sp.]|nr:hypothetical protein [Prevotella sp.]
MNKIKNLLLAAMTPYRKPIFKPAHYEMGDPGLLTGAMRAYYEAMRYETIIDDGKTCVIEWCHIISKQGQKERNRIAMSGCSAYTRNDEGYLCSVRISDYAGHEGEIDWTKTDVPRDEAYSINLVDEFHGGCGMKPQEEY